MGISRQLAIDCFRSDDLIGIAMESDALRRRLHPEGVVTYSCVSTVSADGSSIQASGTESRISSATVRVFSASGDVRTIQQNCASVRNRFCSAWIEAGFSGSVLSTIDATDAVTKCLDAGADTIFVDPRTERGDYTEMQAAALASHRAAHARGSHTVAIIPFGCGESILQRLDFLEAVHRIQEETGGFTACLPLGLEAPGGRELDGVTAVERLKMLAVTRMCLDNVLHLRSVQTGAGLKVLQTGLRFGADDAEIRVPQPGITEPELRRVIRDAGFRPVERDGAYSTMYLN
jgi:cyclic dehypoxanthinyl futalosine synthase